MRGFAKFFVAAALGAAAFLPGTAQAWDGPRHWGPPRGYYAPQPPPVYYVPPRPVFLPPPPPRHWGPPRGYYAPPPRHWGPPPGHWRHHDHRRW